MSADDADAFIESVVEHELDGTALSVGELVVFVDYREDRARRGLSFAAALTSVVVKDVEFVLLRGNLLVGDVIVARVVASTAGSAALDECITLSSSGLPPSSMLATPTTLALVPLLVYERKTTMDLVSSLRATSSVPGVNHMDDQIHRLAAFRSRTRVRVRLLLEGFMSHALTKAPVGSMNVDGVHSFLAKLDFNHGIGTIQSADTSDSARQVLKDARFLQRYDVTPADWTYLGRDTRDTLVSVRKRDNADERVYYLSVLQAVTGMSPARAKALAAVYPNIPSLVFALEGALSTKQRRALITDIRVGRRSLGKAIADRVIRRYYQPTNNLDMSTTTIPASPTEAPQPTRAPDAPLRPMRAAKRKALELTIPLDLVEENEVDADDDDFGNKSDDTEDESSSSSEDEDEDSSSSSSSSSEDDDDDSTTSTSSSSSSDEEDDDEDDSDE